MLSEKIQEKVTEMEVYFRIKGVDYQINNFEEKVVYFVFKPFNLDEDYGIILNGGISLEKDFINIIVRMEYNLDRSKYNKILSVLNKLNNEVLIKYYINTFANQVEAVCTIKNFDFSIPNYYNNTDYIWSIFSQIVMSFPKKDIFRKIMNA